MFDTEFLTVARESASRFADELDATALGGDDLRVCIDNARALSSIYARVADVLCARYCEGDRAALEGSRSPAHATAAMLGTTIADATRRLATTAALESLPESSAAIARGEISPRQAEIIADAASVDPSAESELIAAAHLGSIAVLSDVAARVKARSLDADEARERIFKSRYLRTWCDSNGAFRMSMSHTPEVGAELQSVINGVSDAYFRRARVEGRYESPDAYRADALTAIVGSFAAQQASGTTQDPGDPASPSTDEDPTGPSRTSDASAIPDNSSRSSIAANPPSKLSTIVPALPGHWIPKKVIVRIDHAALMRGTVDGDEASEIAGIGPIAVSTVREIIATQDPFIAAVLTKGTEVTKVVHLGRRPTALQRTALEWMYSTCAVSGCPARVHLEIDHRADWATTRETRLDQLDRLCTFHHDLKSTSGWALVEGTGKRDFVPPGDPRHPGTSPSRAAPHDGSRPPPISARVAISDSSSAKGGKQTELSRAAPSSPKTECA